MELEWEMRLIGFGVYKDYYMRLRVEEWLEGIDEWVLFSYLMSFRLGGYGLLGFLPWLNDRSSYRHILVLLCFAILVAMYNDLSGLGQYGLIIKWRM